MGLLNDLTRPTEPRGDLVGRTRAIKKARTYLPEGQHAPEGSEEQEGPRGGRYYEDPGSTPGELGEQAGRREAAGQPTGDDAMEAVNDFMDIRHLDSYLEDVNEDFVSNPKRAARRVIDAVEEVQERVASRTGERAPSTPTTKDVIGWMQDYYDQQEETQADIAEDEEGGLPPLGWNPDEERE